MIHVWSLRVTLCVHICFTGPELLEVAGEQVLYLMLLVRKSCRTAE